MSAASSSSAPTANRPWPAASATSRLRSARRAAVQIRRAAQTAGQGGRGAASAKPLSQKLVEELVVQRRDILAINLASNSAIALDYPIFAIADSALYSAQARHDTARPVALALSHQLSREPKHTLMADMRETLDLSWTEHRRTVDRFAAFSALTICQGELASVHGQDTRSELGIDKKVGQSGPEPIDDHLATLMGINAYIGGRPRPTT